MGLRVHSAVFSLFLAAGLGSLASAQGRASSPPTTPFTVRLVLADTGQALIHHEARRTYLLVRKGQLVGDFRVTEIGTDRITVESRGIKLVVYAAPAAAVEPAEPARSGSSAPIAVQRAGEPDFLVPEGGVPIDPYGPRVHPPGSAPDFLPPDTGLVNAGTSVSERWIDRADLERMSGNLDRLGREASVSVAADGRLVVVRVSRGAYLYRLGLRRGDIIRSIAGLSPRSVEDAAAIYSRVLRGDRFRVEIERGGERVIFAYRISSD